MKRLLMLSGLLAVLLLPISPQAQTEPQLGQFTVNLDGALFSDQGLTDYGGGGQLGLTFAIDQDKGIYGYTSLRKLQWGHSAFDDFSAGGFITWELGSGWWFLLLASTENAVGSNSFTDYGGGFGLIKRIKTFSDPKKWESPPTFDLKCDVRAVAGDQAVGGNYTILQLGVAFTPGKKLAAK